MSKLKSTNPYNGKTLKEFDLLTAEELENKLSKSSMVSQDWQKTKFSERAEKMRKAASVLKKNKDHYAEIISLEMGKVIKESRAEVEKCALVCEYYADHAEEFLKAEPIELPDGAKAIVLHQPLGAVLAVMPWNFPFWQVFRFAAPTLMAGNVGLL